MGKFLFLLVLLIPVLAIASDGIDINAADLQQLDKITGIGPAYAQRIIDGRPYLSLNDLLKVKGIGPATLQKIKDQGLACVNCSAITQPPAPPPTPPPTITYPTGIFINEILPNPEGADETDEWIELYNSNNLDVSLSGWEIKDSAGTATTFAAPENTIIPANGFLIFKRPETKIMLNNDGDELSLLTPGGGTEDQISFSKAPLGQSYNKISGNWAWSATSTPGAVNIITSPSARSGSSDLPKKQKNDSNIIEAENLTAALNQNNPEKNLSDFNGANPWFLFFIVLGTAIILAASVLFIKNKFLNANVRT